MDGKRIFLVWDGVPNGKMGLVCLLNVHDVSLPEVPLSETVLSSVVCEDDQWRQDFLGKPFGEDD